MRVFAVASYPVEAAASRYRVVQYIPFLRQQGIDLEFSPFVDSKTFAVLYDRRRLTRKVIGLGGGLLKRIGHLASVRSADAILVQREAMLFGPPWFERFAAARRPIVLDLDDPTYLGTVASVYGKAVAKIRWQHKGDQLIRLASIVLCGNATIAAHVEALGVEARVVPTVVDLSLFRPAEGRRNGVPVIGWLGTFATYPYLEAMFPMLRRLYEKHPFILKIVGSGRPAPDLHPIEVQHSEWKLENEINDFRSFDIGLYPLLDEPYSRGKSGFKAVQYMAVGIPFVTSPVGVCATIGEPGRTHFVGATEGEWEGGLQTLLSNPQLRREMGARGRQHAGEHYTVEQQANAIAGALRDAIYGWSRGNRRAA